jgi:hypothetical protein
VERLSPPAAGARRGDDARRLLALRRILGLPNGSVDDLLELLYAHLKGRVVHARARPGSKAPGDPGPSRRAAPAKTPHRPGACTQITK